MPSVSFLPFLQSVPFCTRLLVLTNIIFTLAALLLSVLVDQNTAGGSSLRHAAIQMPWLVLSPGKSWLYPWTLLTSGWVELNIVELFFSALSLGFAARYLERVWGPKDLIRFCCVTIVGSNVIAFGFAWLTYLVIGAELDAAPYHGLSGLQSGFLVAFTQLIPEHQLQLFGIIKMRVKASPLNSEEGGSAYNQTLPGIYLLVSNVLVILLGPSPYILIQFGFFVAWVYLRFFKLSENGDFRGDRSETFAFQYWFPPPVRPYISLVANRVFALAVRLKVVQGWDEHQSSGYAMLPGPGGARAEAERRRALALKALDARLASGTPAPTSASPSTTTNPVLPTPAAKSASTAPPAPKEEGKVKE